jgi:predicted RNA-binding Zn-ribbon protein involved in translation (DUF1610 family)
MAKKKTLDDRDVSPNGFRFQLADPAVPVTCPTCGEQLIFIRTDRKTHIYRCPNHRLVMLPPEGRLLRPQGRERHDDVASTKRI